MSGDETDDSLADDPRDLRQKGFRSPAAEYIGQKLSLDRKLNKNPPSTFFWRVRGDELRVMGIRDGDLLVVDRSRRPMHGSLAVCIIDRQFRIRRLRRWGDVLVPMPLRRRPEIDPLEPAEVWGVVRAIVRDLEHESRPG
jgi:DNA polymerase V